MLTIFNIECKQWEIGLVWDWIEHFSFYNAAKRFHRTNWNALIPSSCSFDNDILEQMVSKNFHERWNVFLCQREAGVRLLQSKRNDVYGEKNDFIYKWILYKKKINLFRFSGKMTSALCSCSSVSERYLTVKGQGSKSASISKYS